ncbi:MAG: hypothetical protein ABI175_26545 [Polyangiales bacterium]
MRILLVVAAALMCACGKGEAPKAEMGSGSATPVAKVPPRTLQLADVPVSGGAPFELHDLTVMKVASVEGGKLTADTGVIRTRVTVKPTGTVHADARLSVATTCRTHDLNLAFDEDRSSQRQNIVDAVGKHAGEIEALYRADPFEDPPQPCELVLRYRADKTTPPVAVAVVCYKDDKLAVGACPAGTFPPPVGDGAEVVLAPTVKANFKDGSAGIHGMFTLVKALAPDEELGSTWRCSDGKKVIVTKKGSDSVVFWTPSAMTAGTSADGGLTTFFEGEGGEATRCELSVEARTAKSSRPLGAFCIDKAGAVARGACTPKL